MKTFLHRARFVFALSFALMLVVPLTRVHAGGRRSAPREPFKPVYNAITSVDATAQTITYNTVNAKIGGGASKTLKVTKSTEIEVNGQRGTLNDLKAGMKVNVTISMSGTDADRISASPAPAEPTPYPTMAPRPRR